MRGASCSLSDREVAHMKRALPFVGLICLSLAVVGCSQSSGPPAEPATKAPSAPADTNAAKTKSSAQVPVAKPSAAVAAAPSYGQPDQAVAAFLKALRDGDNHVAEAMLTPKAREETAKRNLAVQPPGTPSASFEIGKVEYLTADKNGAHVNCVWHERDDKSAPTSYEIVWALRRLPDGWHIAGMATQVAPTEPPVFLNFEDPDDMLAKWRAAEERLARQEGQVRQATKPEAAAPSQPATR